MDYVDPETRRVSWLEHASVVYSELMKNSELLFDGDARVEGRTLLGSRIRTDR